VIDEMEYVNSNNQKFLNIGLTQTERIS